MPLSRRRFLESAALAVPGAVGGSFATGSDDPAAGSVHDWPMARYDPAGTGHHPAATGPKAGVEIAWTHETPDWFLGTTAPIRLGNTVYAAGDGLLALDSETGAREFASRGPSRSTPARAPASVYTTDTLATTAPSGIFGLNAGGGVEIPLLGLTLGSKRWDGPQSAGGGFLGPADPATPVTADGTIYSALPGTNSIVALGPNDGRVQWRRTHHEDDAVSAAFNRPAVKDGLVFVTNWPHQATAYQAGSGERRWQRELDEQMILAPVATDEGVVVPSRSGVQLLDTADGTTLWKRDLDGNATESVPAVADGTIFVADELESLHAVDLATGEPKWSVPFQGPTAPVVADGCVYAVRSQFELVAIDATTGEKRFTYEPTQIPLSTPIVGDGVLYAANRERILALAEAR